MIFDRIDELKAGLEKKKTIRGEGRKVALVHLSLRIPQEVMDFFDQKYPYKKQAKMREILANFMKQELNNEKTK
jgi:uncharacterized protein (DUF4415 family)